MELGVVPTVCFPDTLARYASRWDVPDELGVLKAFLDPDHPGHRLAAAADGVPPGPAEAGDVIGESNAVAGAGFAIDVVSFVRHLRSALSDTCCAIVEYPDQVSAGAVQLSVGMVLGRVPSASAPPLTDPVTRVRAGDDSNAWHSDAAPWRVPPRWSVIAMIAEDRRYAGEPTQVSPISHLLERWNEDPAHLEVLRTAEIDWRESYGGAVDALWAPVLTTSAGREDHVRWCGIRRLLPAVFAPPTQTRTTRAFEAFDRVTRGNEDCYKPVLAPGRILVMDNWRAVHRAPDVPKSSSRTLTLARVNGYPY